MQNGRTDGYRCRVYHSGKVYEATSFEEVLFMPAVVTVAEYETLLSRGRKESSSLKPEGRTTDRLSVCLSVGPSVA